MPSRLEVIVGPMFSGKSGHLLLRADRARIAKKKVLAVKPVMDTRTDGIAPRKLQTDGTTTHTDYLSAHEVGTSEELLHDRRNGDLHVYIAGLDMTWDGKPFNGMPGLCAIADSILKVTAICSTCTNEAQFSQRLSKSTSKIAIGDAYDYEPRCRTCFVPPD